jgi:hypothetical protein
MATMAMTGACAILGDQVGIIISGLSIFELFVNDSSN